MWIKLERIIDKGIDSIGNLAFLRRVLSKTILGVALDKDKEKNVQGKRPEKRKR